MVRPERDRLAGTVEIDETYLAGVEKGVRGRQVEAKALIVVAAQEDGGEIGRVRLRQIADASAASLIPFVQDSVEPGSVIHTDGWLGYEPLEKARVQQGISAHDSRATSRDPSESQTQGTDDRRKAEPGRAGMPRVQGRVKWLNYVKGYGFISAQNGPGVFVQYSEIPGEGLREGDLVEFEIVQATHGPMAVRVVKLGEAQTGTRPQETASQSPHDKGKPTSAWDVLGVRAGAGMDEISAAYHRAAQMYHPDKVATLGPEFRELAERRMKEINAAYEELKHGWN
jgi:cold shock CspA family protein